MESIHGMSSLGVVSRILLSSATKWTLVVFILPVNLAD